ncbi:hypothetical protein [Flavobacterium sp. JP2137]|uniref:hypothetical protein n=1 Tax=Flavobacterium sp. JP2137 TaxID=3414510 RepID=UPI003D2FDC13
MIIIFYYLALGMAALKSNRISLFDCKVFLSTPILVDTAVCKFAFAKRAKAGFCTAELTNRAMFLRLFATQVLAVRRANCGLKATWFTAVLAVVETVNAFIISGCGKLSVGIYRGCNTELKSFFLNKHQLL